MRKIIAVLLALALALMLGLGLSALAEEGNPAAEAPETPGMLAGGWQVSADAAVTEETKALLAQAFGDIDGEPIVPVAVLGTQVVAGRNLCVLCRITPDAADAVPYYALIYLYQDLEGNAKLLQIRELDLGLLFDEDNG